MARTITPAERELDKRLASFGLVDSATPSDLSNNAGSETTPPASDSPREEQTNISDEGVTQENHEGGENTGDDNVPGDHQDPSSHQPNHNWEKRAKDNQRSFHREQKLRQEEGRAYQERIKQLEEMLRSRRPVEDDEDDRQFATDNPEAFTYMKKREERQRQREVADIQAGMEDAFKSDLTRMVPNWQTILGSQEFKEWKANQRRSIREILENTFQMDAEGSFIYEPADVVDVLESFKSTNKGYVPNQPSEGQGQPPRPRNGSTPSGDPRPDVFSLDELNDTSLADKFMRKAGRDRAKASKEFDEKYWRSVNYWRSKGYASA